MKVRCFKCKKKVLIGLDCKCEKVFCLNCLPWYEHSCEYDYKANNKMKLTEDNPKITYKIVDKI